MATYYDGLNAFHELNEKNPLTSTAQLVYLHLLHLNNRLGNVGTIQVSDRELEQRTRLSKQSITNAKRTLKGMGLIDFKSDRQSPGRITTYALKFFSEKVGQTAEQAVGQTVGRDSRLSPRFDSAKKEEREENKKTASATALDELLEAWEQAGGARLNKVVITKLAALLERHTPEAFKDALERAATATNNRYGFSYDFFLSKLEEQSSKGGWANGSYDRPAEDDEAEWRGYV